jgi:hypothetical protein
MWIQQMPRWLEDPHRFRMRFEEKNDDLPCENSWNCESGGGLHWHREFRKWPILRARDTL